MTQVKRWNGSALEAPSQLHHWSQANGLEQGTFYRYDHASGSVEQIWPAQASDIPAPGLSAQAQGESQIDLTITDNSRTERQWKVYRSTSSGFTPGPGNLIATVAATTGMDATAGTQVYNDTGLAADTTYYYKVRGVNQNVDGELSAQAAATTDESAPSAPTGLSATAAGTDQVDLSWTDVSGEDEYRIERESPVGGGFSQIDTVGAGVTSYSDTGLDDDTQYNYRVRACNTGGCSGYSNEDSATTDLAVPAAPSAMAITSVDCDSFDYSFTDNADDESGFDVYWRKQGDPWPGTPSATHGSSAGTGGTVSGTASSLTSATTYEVKAVATNAAGDSADSNVASDTLDSVPSQPTGESATTQSDDQIDLSVNTVSGATGYKWYRSTSTGFTPGAGNKIADTGTPSYSDTGLSQDTTYYYRCIAYNACGDSTTSQEFNATTWPTAPQNASASQTDSPLPICGSEDAHIDVSWDNGGNDISQLTIERDTDNAFPSPTTLSSSLAAGTEGYGDTISPSDGTTYYYRVKFNDSTPEEWSNTASAAADCQL